jgi:hypothetical protein
MKERLDRPSMIRLKNQTSQIKWAVRPLKVTRMKESLTWTEISRTRKNISMELMRLKMT